MASDAATSLVLAFEVGSRARIRGQDVEVVVRLVRWDGNELDYFVTWWDDNNRKEGWVRTDELERA